MHQKELLAHIELTAPLFLAAPWDKCGVQIASPVSEIKTLCVALDPSLETIEQAIQLGAEFLLCHHPITLAPKLPDKYDDFHRILALTLGHNLWIYSAHTSLDANPDGPVNWLARNFELLETEVLEVCHTQAQTLVRLLTEVDEHILNDFAQYSYPTNKQRGEFLFWPEELNRFQQCVHKNMYIEMPVSSIKRQFGFGCIGTLPQTLDCAEFLDRLGQLLPLPWRSIGPLPEQVRTIAYCPGSGADLAQQAFFKGADVFLTGDVKYHQAQSLQDMGLTLDVGHFCFEEAMMRTWSEDLARDLGRKGVQVKFISGRDPFTIQCQPE